MPKLTSPEDVLHFWFGDSRNGKLDAIVERKRVWFTRSSPEFESVQFDNIALIAALKGGESSWDIENDPMAALAAVIVLDQFSRAVYRGTADAFAGDELAASIVKKIVGKGWFLRYSPVERMFLVVSTQHSEQMAMQSLGLQLVPLVSQGADADVADHFANMSEFVDHFETMKRFGRFPHRNALLGRESTPAEKEWLESPDCPHWAKSQQQP